MLRHTIHITVFLMMTTPVVAVDWLVSLHRSNDVTVRAQPAANESVDTRHLVVQTTGADPHVVGRLSAPLNPQECVLQFDYFSTTGISSFSVMLGPPLVESRRIGLPSLTIAEGWQTVSFDLEDARTDSIPDGASVLRFDFGNAPAHDIQIRDVRLRRRTEKETHDRAFAEARTREKKYHASAFKDYLKQQRQELIKSVAVTKDHVKIRLSAQLLTTMSDHPKASNLRADFKSGDWELGDWELIEHRPHQAIYDDASQVAFELNDQHLVLPRRSGSYDRVCSSWRLRSKSKGEMTSRIYATSIDPSPGGHSAQRHQPQSQKGLTCLSNRGPRQDFVDLGISNVTINFLLSRFLSTDEGPGRVRIDVPGDPVFFSPSGFRGYDGLMEFACEHDMVVSAIVLIPGPKNHARRSPLIHPDADGGTYAMPDLTTPRGAVVYQYVINEIASRYRNHQENPGGVSNWIVHNEIDFHTIWTNMGKQPRELVAETYYRSMRLIDSVVKQHNPHARVFASLTHHWNGAKPENWVRFSPRWLLETLQQLSRAEGDFDWGVAYHPYPQSLFARVPWEDSRVTEQLDSPLITMQNLEVLGRFLQQKEMLKADGEMRGVILSEQGFHSHSYDAADQDAQAAALCWAMRRVKEMPWVESFIYHRWIDHPREGGLMLGLRMLPTKDHPGGKRKRAWEVFQAIGTDRESLVTKGLSQPPL